MPSPCPTSLSTLTPHFPLLPPPPPVNMIIGTRNKAQACDPQRLLGILLPLAAAGCRAALKVGHKMGARGLAILGGLP